MNKPSSVKHVVPAPKPLPKSNNNSLVNELARNEAVEIRFFAPDIDKAKELPERLNGAKFGTKIYEPPRSPSRFSSIHNHNLAQNNMNLNVKLEFAKPTFDFTLMKKSRSYRSLSYPFSSLLPCSLLLFSSLLPCSLLIMPFSLLLVPFSLLLLLVSLLPLPCSLLLSPQLREMYREEVCAPWWWHTPEVEEEAQ